MKLFLVDVYPVKEQSMWPTLDGGPGTREIILVDKVAVLLGRPERFRIYVFRHKDGQLLVKRLLGLPGETIDFRGGDLFAGANVDDLARVPRPAELVEAQMLPVPPGGGGPELEVRDGRDGRLDREGAAFAFTPVPGRTLAASVVGGAGADRYCIKDDHLAAAKDGDPLRIVRGREAVPDVRITLGKIALGDGTLTLVHRIGAADVRKVVVRRDGLEVVREGAGPDSGTDRFPGVTCREGLRIETLDGWFRVSRRDGSGWIELGSNPRDTAHAEGFSGVDLQVSGGAVRIASLEVKRDVHYASGAERPGEQRHTVIPDDCMFLVGDNPEVSKDSRDRAIGPVPESSLVGVVRAVVMPFGRMRIPR